MNRRGFLAGLSALVAAPFVARAPAIGGLVTGRIPTMLTPGESIIPLRKVYLLMNGRKIAEAIVPHIPGVINRHSLNIR